MLKFVACLTVLLVVLFDHTRARSIRSVKTESNEVYKKAEEYFMAVQDYLDPSEYIVKKLQDKKTEASVVEVAMSYYTSLYDNIQKGVNVAYGVEVDPRIPEEKREKLKMMLEKNYPKLHQELSKPYKREKVLNIIRDDILRELRSYPSHAEQTSKLVKERNLESFRQLLEKLKRNVDTVHDEVERILHTPFVKSDGTFESLKDLGIKLDQEKETHKKAFIEIAESFSDTFNFLESKTSQTVHEFSMYVLVLIQRSVEHTIHLIDTV